MISKPQSGDYVQFSYKKHLCFGTYFKYIYCIATLCDSKSIFKTCELSKCSNVKVITEARKRVISYAISNDFDNLECISLRLILEQCATPKGTFIIYTDKNFDSVYIDKSDKTTNIIDFAQLYKGNEEVEEIIKKEILPYLPPKLATYMLDIYSPILSVNMINMQ